MDAQAHVMVSGVVQGVGYRYFVSRRARSLGLKGWVKNCPDGQVEMVMEGARGLIESVIQILPTGNQYATVRQVRVEWHPFSGKYSGFDVRY